MILQLLASKCMFTVSNPTTGAVDIKKKDRSVNHNKTDIGYLVCCDYSDYY